MTQQGTQPVETPSITSGAQSIPVVDRVTPQLSLRAEIVGRDSGNEARPALFVQQEELRIRPDVTGVRRNKKRQVADQAYTLVTSVLLQLIGLAEHQELRKANLIDFVC